MREIAHSLNGETTWNIHKTKVSPAIIPGPEKNHTSLTSKFTAKRENFRAPAYGARNNSSEYLFTFHSRPSGAIFREGPGPGCARDDDVVIQQQETVLAIRTAEGVRTVQKRTGAAHPQIP